MDYVRKEVGAMVLHLNNGQLSDHTERYKDAGLSQEFIGEMAKVISALKATGYEPYDQLYGYVMIPTLLWPIRATITPGK